MLKSYTHTTAASTSATICTAETGKELTIMSIMLNGGDTGGTITFTLSSGFTFAFSLDAKDIVVLDHKINLPTGTNLSVTADAAGIQVCVSAAELEVA